MSIQKTPALQEARIALEAADHRWHESCSDTAVPELIQDGLNALADAEREHAALETCAGHLNTIALRLERWQKTGIEAGRLGKDCNFDQLVKLVKKSLSDLAAVREGKAVQS